MLCKDPNNRIDLLDIYDHPFVIKQKYGADENDRTPQSSIDEDEQEDQVQEESLQTFVNESKQAKMNRRKTTFAPKTLFNIEEMENETTGNNVRINLKNINSD